MHTLREFKMNIKSWKYLFCLGLVQLVIVHGADLSSVLHEVGEFRGIVARGEKRPVISAHNHRDLVKKNMM